MYGCLSATVMLILKDVTMYELSLHKGIRYPVIQQQQKSEVRIRISDCQTKEERWRRIIYRTLLMISLDALFLIRNTYKEY